VLWLDRLKVVLRTLAYREAWKLQPRQSLGMLRYLWHTRPTWRAGEAELNVYSPPVGSAAYARYLHGLRLMGQGKWVPLVVHVSVTDRCPYRCRRCSNVTRGDEDPSVESLVRLAEQLRAAGTCRVAITGGEPLLRDDLPAIVEVFGRELSPVLFTSGYGLDLSKARQLQQAGLAAAYVSLDHFLAEEHDRIRGQTGAFGRALDAIQACREAGLYTAAQAVVGPSLWEKGRLDQFLAFCNSLGAHEVMLLEEVPMCDGSANAEKGDLDETIRRRLATTQLRSARNAMMPKVSSMSWLESPECLGCQAGFSFLYVAARGDVYPCDFVPLSFGNVHELGVPAIHRRMLQFLRRPSSTCLARKLHRIYGVQKKWPVSWKDAQAILPDYDPGPPPKLLRYLCHDCNRSA
jgi:MoaA/NifB/PqqE/SkfB family radical SAM enzyme